MKLGGSCVLTMFRPLYDRDTMRRQGVRNRETIEWEQEIGDERIVGSNRCPQMDPENLVLYPELIFRRYRCDELVEEVVMPIVMRCWYPDQIAQLVEDQGFRVLNKNAYTRSGIASNRSSR